MLDTLLFYFYFYFYFWDLLMDKKRDSSSAPRDLPPTSSGATHQNFPEL